MVSFLLYCYAITETRLCRNKDTTMTENKTAFHQDVRFWLILIALLILIWMATQMPRPDTAVSGRSAGTRAAQYWNAEIGND